jgi:hypothetical protein
MSLSGYSICLSNANANPNPNRHKEAPVDRHIERCKSYKEFKLKEYPKFREWHDKRCLCHLKKEELKTKFRYPEQSHNGEKGMHDLCMTTFRNFGMAEHGFSHIPGDYVEPEMLKESIIINNGKLMDPIEALSKKFHFQGKTKSSKWSDFKGPVSALQPTIKKPITFTYRCGGIVEEPIFKCEYSNDLYYLYILMNQAIWFRHLGPYETLHAEAWGKDLIYTRMEDIPQSVMKKYSDYLESND